MNDDIPEDFREEIKQTFDLFDKDENGTIDREELSEVFKSLGQHFTEAELTDMIQEVGTDQSDAVNFEEFLELMRRRSRVADIEEEMIEAFKVYDRDCDGKISLQDLKQVMRQIGENLTDKDC